MFFSLHSMIGHPRLAAWYEKQIKGMKGDVSFIIQARCLADSLKTEKEKKVE
jgi:hypothetical protein